MSFNNEIENVKDESKPNGIRYMSLKHAIGLHPVIGGFGETWSLLENKFGLKEGENNEASVLVKCAEFIETDRKALQNVKEAHEKYIKCRVKLGLPKPKFNCE
ncbi:MAG TPA: hypothetical protein ENK06_14135 [Gammaproteobacteria bacterium]|nr:hypothetical protein [Gammaproteobacteria bacterium]